jgi:hypothetical protein
MTPLTQSHASPVCPPDPKPSTTMSAVNVTPLVACAGIAGVTNAVARPTTTDVRVTRCLMERLLRVADRRAAVGVRR